MVNDYSLIALILVFNADFCMELQRAIVEEQKGVFFSFF